ncbi:2',3'-cyclic-nucleotide 2'-phosphodiesterase/5'-or 3'-nucleotidase, 5'-nucleotidase family [Bacillus sp. OV322]|nr:Ig-like domain-containing protein [Bacillus sp. OV322]SFC23271.1 2',3'-cyclic-nucleotide 2'-phosphodiesterase/5'-or 3'-nucleotidase, 5'-nucleotidase family [Bacillus sp. OV322]
MKKKQFTRLGQITASALLFGSFMSPAGQKLAHAEDTAANVKVQILGINDFHGQLDKTTKINGQVTGTAAYLAAYLKKLEATNPNTIKVSAGDAVGASSPVSALLQDEPTIKFLNLMKFDIGTLGNHEFDEGVAEMKRLVNGGEHPKTKQYGTFEGANFPYISANVIDKSTGKPIFDPYIIKEEAGQKIGFIGVTYSDTPSIVIPSGVEGVEFTDEAEAINKYTKELKDQGVKAIVVLAHNPGTSNLDGSNPTGEAIDLANTVDDEVDVIFAAHDHKYLNSTVDGKLLVQAYSSGAAISDVNLEIDPATHDIVKKDAQIVNTLNTGIEPDAEAQALVDKYLNDIKPIISEEIGTASMPLTRDQNESGESVLGNVIADSMRTEMKTDFGFMNPGGIRANIDQGTINWGQVYTVEPFGNDLVKMTLTGAQIRDVLNQQWQPEKTNMLQISGLTYTWSDALPKGQKVVNIFLPDGKKIDPNAEYTATVNNFMSTGGDSYTAFTGGKNKVTGPVDFNALLNYLKAQSPVSGAIEGRIKKVTDITADAPVVNPVTDHDSFITGKAEAGSKLTVWINGKEFKRDVLIGANGTFKIKTLHLKAGTTVSASITDAAENDSEKTTVTVLDKTAPHAPYVHIVRDYDKKVTGKAEAGSTVTVKRGKTLWTGVADRKGMFSVKLDKQQKAGTLLYVFAADKSKNISSSVKLIVKDATAPKAPVVHAVKAGEGWVTGKAEAYSKVYVKSHNKVIGYAYVGKNGTFTVKMKKQKAGTALYVSSKDRAGNTSKTVKIFVKR